MVMFCLLHADRNTSSKSQGLTSLIRGRTGLGGVPRSGVSASYGNEGNSGSQTGTEMKLKHSTLNLLHVTKHDNEIFLAHISS